MNFQGVSTCCLWFSHQYEFLVRSKSWCMGAYRIFEAIAASPEVSAASGIQMGTSAFFFSYQVVDNENQLKKFLEAYPAGAQGVRFQFRFSSNLIDSLGIDPSYGAADAYELIVPGK